MTRRTGVFLLALLAACGTGSDDADKVTIDTLPGGIPRTISKAPVDSGEWHLVLERTVQPEEGMPGEFSDPSNLALADDGTLYVVDSKPTTVKRFDSTGKFLGSIGRGGDGPGEFRAGFIALRGDTLVLQDPRASRATMFNATDGSLLLTRPSGCCYWWPMAIDGEGRGVVRVMLAPDSAAPGQPFIRFSLDGSRIDTVRVTQHPAADHKNWFVRENGKLVMSTPVLLSPNDVENVDESGGFLSGWSGEYLLRVSRNGRDTVALFGRTGEPAAISAREKTELIARLIKDRFAESEFPEATLRASFPARDIPDHRPAFEGISTDRSGRRWVRLSTSDTTAVHMDLFDRDGRWLDQVTVKDADWARGPFEPMSWSRDHVAVRGEGADGRPLVRIYRIDRGKGR